MNPPKAPPPPLAPQKVAPMLVTKGCRRRDVMSGRFDGSLVRQTYDREVVSEQRRDEKRKKERRKENRRGKRQVKKGS